MPLILSALLLQIYGSSQLQGPSLPTANRTALDQVGAWGMHLVLASGSTGWGQVPLQPWTVSKAALFADQSLCDAPQAYIANPPLLLERIYAALSQVSTDICSWAITPHA